MADEPTVSRETGEYRGRPSRDRLVEIVRFFLKIGLVGFGGPLVHIAMMEDELVGKGSREWADESTFMEGLAICNMLPGPASTQLGIFMGWVRAGNPGAIVAGMSFMAPTFVIIVALSYLYFAYNRLPVTTAVFYGVNPVVIGLIVGASYSMGRSALAAGEENVTFTVGSKEWRVDVALLGLLVGAFVVTATVNPNPVLEFLAAGVVALLVYQSAWVRANAVRLFAGAVVAALLGVAYRFRRRVVELLTAWASGIDAFAPLAVAAGVAWANVWVKLFFFMLYTGSFIYGGGLVLIPFIEKYVVTEFGWMSAGVFVDGIALGQLTPGPVVMTTAFVGYELLLPRGVPTAVLGAFVATVGAFAPSFLFIVAMFPYVAKVRRNPRVKAALVGVNAAVVGAILGATVLLAREAIVDAFTASLAVATFALFLRDVDAAYLILGGGGLGVAVYALL